MKNCEGGCDGTESGMVEYMEIRKSPHDPHEL